MSTSAQQWIDEYKTKILNSTGTHTSTMMKFPLCCYTILDFLSQGYVPNNYPYATSTRTTTSTPTQQQQYTPTHGTNVHNYNSSTTTSNSVPNTTTSTTTSSTRSKNTISTSSHIDTLVPRAQVGMTVYCAFLWYHIPHFPTGRALLLPT
jgi:hypothetical protein